MRPQNNCRTAVMPTDEEARQISFRATQLRSGEEYRRAGRLIRLMDPRELAHVTTKNDVYGAARLQIGTWDQISLSARALSAEQRKEFFNGQPVGHMWRRLQYGVVRIRTEILKDSNYGSAFEQLHGQYDEWLKTDGRRFNTGDDPGGCVAMFC
jgi:hypothetical protein